MAKRLSAAQINKQLTRIHPWKRQGKKLLRAYKFKDFVEAMTFVKRIVPLAEGMDHHPDIFISYSRVRLTLSTHSAGGLTALDFELARKINAL